MTMHTIFLSIFALFFLFFCAVVIFAACSKKVAAKKAAAAKENLTYPSRRQLSLWEEAVFFFVAEGCEECCIGLFEDELEEAGYDWSSFPEDDSSLIEKLEFIVIVAGFGYNQSREWSECLYQGLRPQLIETLTDIRILQNLLPKSIGKVRSIQVKSWFSFLRDRPRRLSPNHYKTLLNFFKAIFGELESLSVSSAEQVEALDRLLRVA